MTEADVGLFIAQQQRNLRQTVDLMRYLIGNHDWSVALVHLFEIDPVFHALWHGVDESHPAFNTAIRDLLTQFFAQVDQAIGDMIATAQPVSTLVFSEHGFDICRKTVNLSRCLQDQGVIEQVNSSGRLSWRVIGVEHESSCAFPDHKVIYLPRRHSSATQRLLDGLVGLVDPETGTPVLRTVCQADELYTTVKEMGWDVIVLDPAQGYTVRNGNVSDPPFLSAAAAARFLNRNTHANRALGIFCS